MSEGQQRILIADDREENRYVLSRVLTGAGYDCFEAATGAKALEGAQTLPDLVILDVRLPDVSGYEVCQQIKQSPRTASVPVLQISASFVSSEDRVRALNAGADGYLTHPIDRMVLVATVRALLRLQRAELEARRSAEQWQATFNALAEGLALIDHDNRLLRWNGAFDEICAATALPRPGEDAAEFLERLVGTPDPVRNGGPDRYSAEFTLGSRSVQVAVSSVEPGSGRSGKVLVLSDITDRKLAEYALRTAEKLAATGKLANAIAHEINNPLEALTNLIYLARHSTELPMIIELLTSASGELDRISRITRQTLAFHRDTLYPIAVNIGSLVGDVVALYQKSSAARRIRLVIQSRPVEPILGYPGQLSQVFGNLLRNATEVAPADSEVTIRVRPHRRAGRLGVRVTIHDRGRGIPREVREKMFDPFFTTKELKGSGLGLWVSKNLVAKHSGTIRFRSSDRVGRNGTTFEVFLPLDGLPADPAETDEAWAAHSGD